MEIEHSVKVFQLDDQLENNLRAMAAEGYMLIPGIVPVAIYHTVRVKGLAPQAGEAPGAAMPIARVSIDDTKVKILRNGELIDGT